MRNTDILTRLQEIGPLPAEDAAAMEDFPLQEFDELLQQLTKPLEFAHSLALINLGPPPDTGAYGVEWALVHSAEGILVEQLAEVLRLADDTQVKRMIAIRLENYLNKQP